MTTAAILAALRDIVGDHHVLADHDLTAGYETDFTGRYSGRATCVVRPGNTAEVAAVLRLCVDVAMPVITQGGNTGLVGGAVPRPGQPAMVLSMRRLRRLDPVDPAAQQVTAGAGVTIVELQGHARSAGFDFALDWAARDSATVGGAVATNAGGSRVLRFGTMRTQLTGIEAVLASGEVIGSLGGLSKETAGVHWPSLLCGSEGTLAVVTAARLRLVPWYSYRSTALVGLASVAEATALLAAVRASVPCLDSAEIMFAPGMALTCAHLGVAPPLAGDHTCFVMFEAADHADPSDVLSQALAGLDGVIATGPQSSTLVAIRERHTEAINAAGVPLKLDVAVPVQALAEFAERLAPLVPAGTTLYSFGHLAEGNIHVNVIRSGGWSTPEAALIAASFTTRVLELVAHLGGTISAEHGIGVAKTSWLHLIRTPGELALLGRLKAAFDPTGVLNPGVLIPS